MRPDSIDGIVQQAMDHNPIGITEDYVRRTVGQMKPGQSLYLETQYNGRSGSLFVTEHGSYEDGELYEKTQTSTRWFLIYRM